MDRLTNATTNAIDRVSRGHNPLRSAARSVENVVDNIGSRIIPSMENSARRVVTQATTAVQENPGTTAAVIVGGVVAVKVAAVAAAAIFSGGALLVGGVVGGAIWYATKDKK